MAFFSPRAVSAVVRIPSDTVTTTLFVTNIHCASCVSHAQDTIAPLHGIFKVDVNLLGHTICVQHEPGLTGTIADVLLDAAFEVRHVTTSDASGRVIGTYDVSRKLDQLKHQQGFSIFMSKTQRKHIENCSACRSKTLSKPTFFGSLSAITRSQKTSQPKDESTVLEAGLTTIETDEKIKHDDQEQPSSIVEKHVAVISIVGMTCASCTGAITRELETIDFIDDLQVNLLSNNATISYRGSASDASKLVDAIEDVGFEATIDKVEPVKPTMESSGSCKALISIEGMTCGSCVAAVTRGLEEVDGVTSVNVDLVGNNATVLIVNKSVVDKVLEAIEDLGFDGSLAELEEDDRPAAKKSQLRTVEFEIDGMYCSMCPQKIIDKIDGNFRDSVEILSTPTLKQPRITVRYLPNVPDLNIRRIKYAIEAADSVIVASVYHPPSMEERSQKVQRKERGRILRHLLFTLVAAIPSFVIGIVYMSLVPENDPTRQWFEEPMWSGNAMRMDWAMFILTTPVMFYGASLFHIRALKEIWSLWRPQSKVPVFRRLYRFGSMNLLISAGTSVAYFSSLAILIMEATAPAVAGDNSTQMKTRHSITYFDTVTFLTLFILCGKFLQAYSKSKTGDAVAMLAKLRPTEALLIDNHIQPYEEPIKSSIRNVPIDLLEIGDIVSIPHGASPPTDGIIDQEGTFLFDESSLTGESRPVRKVKGDNILTGSVNISDPVRIIVKELGGTSMLDQIINVVRSGQAKRAPVERFADIITSYFTPIITLIAISTWIVWLALGQSGVLPQTWLDVDQGGWPFWSVEFAIAVFVVACPCGLGLAAPTALFVGGGLAAKAGILVQGGGEAFQEASRLDTIVFDKTGTLTEGQMRVTDVHLLDQRDEKKLFNFVLQMAKMLEDSCTHPIAKAISTFCKESGADKSDVKVSVINVKEVPGQGMQGLFEVLESGSEQPIRYEAAIGNERQLQALGINSKGDNTVANTFLTSGLNQFQSSGCSTAIFSFRKVMSNSSSEKEETAEFTPTAIFAITDPVRPETASVLRSLRAQNISVHMCTGDNSTTARAIASQLDIPVSNVRAGATPQEKAAYIEELQNLSLNTTDQKQSKRRLVAFVGDGTNDTPALTSADVSIALSSGSDIALTSASFILLNSNLLTILNLINLSKRVFLRVKLNFAWAAVYNVALVPVAAGVFFPIAQWRLSPVWAAAAMAASSISVVLGSLALKLPEIKFSRSITQ